MGKCVHIVNLLLCHFLLKLQSRQPTTQDHWLKFFGFYIHRHRQVYQGFQSKGNVLYFLLLKQIKGGLSMIVSCPRDSRAQHSPRRTDSTPMVALPCLSLHTGFCFFCERAQQCSSSHIMFLVYLWTVLFTSLVLTVGHTWRSSHDSPCPCCDSLLLVSLRQGHTLPSLAYNSQRSTLGLKQSLSLNLELTNVAKSAGLDKDIYIYIYPKPSIATPKWE